MSQSLKNVIIVGGGGGGSHAAQLLTASLDAKKYSVVVIDPRPDFILLPATVRLVVHDIDNLKENVLIPHEKTFTNDNGVYRQDRVTAIESSSEGGGYVVLESGERMPYAVLILSPGSTWTGPVAFPQDRSEFMDFIKQGQDAITSASNIVLVGGGAVGIEIAGEIAERWPEKKITLIQGDKGLLNSGYPNKFRKAVKEALQARGVDVILDDFVDVIPPSGATEVKTRNGKTIKADLCLSTRGPKPNTGFVKASLGDVTSPNGYIKVQPTLQLENHQDIFALGDVVDLPEQKQLMKAMKHAAIINANVSAFLNRTGNLKNYKTGPEMIVVSLGKGGGVAYIGLLWGIVLGDWFSRLVKSKTLLVPALRGSFGLA